MNTGNSVICDLYCDVLTEFLCGIIVITVNIMHWPIEFFHLHAGIEDYFHHGGQRYQMDKISSKLADRNFRTA